MSVPKLIEKSLAEYAKVAGPEPKIDHYLIVRDKIKKGIYVDLAAQHKAWAKWWIEWYRHPLRRSERTT